MIERLTILDPEQVIASIVIGFYCAFALLVVAMGTLMLRVGRLEKRMRALTDALSTDTPDAAT